MAGADLAGELTGVSFSLAERDDDTQIRRLLRENPMGGGIALSMRQEPDYFIESDHKPGRQHTIVARSGEALVAVGSCAIRPRYVNGEVVGVGYLRTLRLDATMSGRFDILRRGYRFLREQWEQWQVPYLFTSIAAENERAIRFLERGLPGMPRYRFLSEFATLMLPVRTRGERRDEECNLEEISEFLDGKNRGRNLSPLWPVTELQGLHALGLGANDFVVLRERSRIVACGAVWDQRSFKQTVIHKYGFREAVQKTLFNCVAPLFRRPPMPSVNEVCPFGFISHFAAEPPHAERLIRRLLTIAAGKGIHFLCAGFAQADPVLATVQARFFAHSYRSRLYQVDWPGSPSSPISARDLNPETALL